MPEEVRLWRVDAGDRLRDIARAPLDLESRIESWLEQDVSILDPHFVTIGRQVPTDFGGVIDLLCLDRSGDLVVVELKRDKTPREITAQVLDYGSWAKDLSVDQIATIADGYLGADGLKMRFAQRFQSEVPEILNANHRLLIVASRIDPASERIIKYLAGTYGVNINAATFQFFTDAQGGEFLARSFIIQPDDVEHQARIRGGTNRRGAFTDEQLEAQADEHGVGELYRQAVTAFGEHLGLNRTKSGITFQIDGRAFLSLLPNDSDVAHGLRFQIYHSRFAEIVGVTPEAVKALLPIGHEPWNQFPKSPREDYQGYRGFFSSRSDVDKLARVLDGAAPNQ